MKAIPLVKFDEFGCFEVEDVALLDSIAGNGSALTSMSMAADNSSCFNRFCQNDVCVRYGGDNVVCADLPDPPNPPDGPNVWCDRPNFACGPLATC